MSVRVLVRGCESLAVPCGDVLLMHGMVCTITCSIDSVDIHCIRKPKSARLHLRSHARWVQSLILYLGLAVA